MSLDHLLVMMTDATLVYPLVKKSDLVHTTYGILPNTITVFNLFIITPLSLCFALSVNTTLLYGLFALILTNVRVYLDCLDGYIARKYDKCSPEGVIYDHVGDAVLIGYEIQILFSPWIPPSVLTPLSYIIILFVIATHFDTSVKKYTDVLHRAFGSNGQEDSYCTLVNNIVMIGILVTQYPG